MVLTQSNDRKVDLRDRTNELTNLIKLYQESTNGSSRDASYLGGKNTWDQVFEEARRAQDQYLREGNGARQIFRKFGNQAHTWDPFLGLLPDGEYTSVLAGGLKLVFHVCETLNITSENRADVVKGRGAEK